MQLIRQPGFFFSLYSPAQNWLVKRRFARLIAALWCQSRRWRRKKPTAAAPKAREDKKINVPPCFIIVCQNTSISKLVYDFISGFHRTNPDGTTTLENGRLPLSSQTVMSSRATQPPGSPSSFMFS